MEIDIAIILAAVLFDLALGDPRRMPHPVVGIGRMIQFLEPILRKNFKSERVAGFVLLISVVTICYLVASLSLYAAYKISSLAAILLAIYMGFVSLAARSLHLESRKVIKAVELKDLSAARVSLSYIVGRETAHLNEEEVIRAVVETVAENSSDGVIAPLFYMILGGPPLAIAYKAVNTLDSMVGYKNDRYLEFGFASARFDDLVNYIPARLTALLMVIVTPICSLNCRNSWRILCRDARNHASPNSGYPEAAAAGALGVRIGGANIYFGKVVEKPTIGDSLISLSIATYNGAIKLMYASEGLLLISWLALRFAYNYFQKGV